MRPPGYVALANIINLKRNLSCAGMPIHRGVYLSYFPRHRRVGDIKVYNILSLVVGGSRSDNWWVTVDNVSAVVAILAKRERTL